VGGGGKKIKEEGRWSSHHLRTVEYFLAWHMWPPSPYNTDVMHVLITEARKIQRNSTHYLKISHTFLTMQHNLYTDKHVHAQMACTHKLQLAIS
jgi:hypothetical protein